METTGRHSTQRLQVFSGLYVQRVRQLTFHPGQKAIAAVTFLSYEVLNYPTIQQAEFRLIFATCDKICDTIRVYQVHLHTLVFYWLCLWSLRHLQSDRT